MKDTIQAIHQRVNELIENNQDNRMTRKKYERVMSTISKALMEDLIRILYFDLEKRIFVTKYKKDHEEWIFTTKPEEAWYQDIIANGEIFKREKDTNILMREGESHINIVWSELQKQMSENPKYDGVNRIILKKDRCYLDHDRRAGRDDDYYITIATQEELTKILQRFNSIT